MGLTIFHENIPHWHATETLVLRRLFNGGVFSVKHVNITPASPIIFSWGTHPCYISIDIAPR